MTPSPQIDALLNLARREAVERFKGRPATDELLRFIGHTIHQLVLVQVERGLWGGVGVHHIEQMADLGVTVRRSTALHEPPLVIDYNFTKTALANVVTRTVQP